MIPSPETAKLFKLIDGVFDEANKAFKAIDIHLGEHLHSQVTERTTIMPSDQHKLWFVAPTKRHRVKMTWTFVKMAWHMALTGQAHMKTKTK